MYTNSAPGDTGGSGPTAEPGVSALILAHKRAAAVVVAIVLFAIAITVVPALAGSNSGALNDATTCSQWAAASAGQKSAYAQRYLDEYGSFSGAGRNLNAVQNTITQRCVRAAYLGEADDVSVLAAVRRDF
jgi:hypothetical protein